MKRLLALITLLAAASGLAFSQQYKVLYNFVLSSSDAAVPYSGLVFDSSGNLYGTTLNGGSTGLNAGTVYELSPNASGGWTETVLYNFCPAGPPCLDGDQPQSTLVMDQAGNLYGTTQAGGMGNDGSGGVAFELSPPSQQGNPWTETVLYNFCSDLKNNECLDGLQPFAGLIFDRVGNLYGTTFEGGRHNLGTVFELSPGSSGWTETVLYNFCSSRLGSRCFDGAGPYSSLIFDKAGNLYGTTVAGGNQSGYAAGVLFELSPGSKGWTENLLAEFTRPGGFDAVNPPVFDSEGNIYSSLSLGGGEDAGALFQWNHATGALREAGFDFTDGQHPNVPFVDQLGRGFFGTTSNGGNNVNGYTEGVIYQASPKGRLNTIYKFCSQTNCTDGNTPYGNLVEDPQGNFYGTASAGGLYDGGVVFEITP
ncbi:MAG: choice-of-anchor tandem repeat GloVer-containing protein [Terriglobales bacterium]|jgi:uncharacterized repeat protein (TIGR03803 family)